VTWRGRKQHSDLGAEGVCVKQDSESCCGPSSLQGEGWHVGLGLDHPSHLQVTSNLHGCSLPPGK
jgi:hypothetical protein